MKKSTLLFMLLCNYIPLITIGVIIAIGLCSTLSLAWRLTCAITFLLVFIPLLANLTLRVFKIREHRITTDSKSFKIWWFTFNLQVIFSRLPFIEEVMRMIPSLYSMWLRLWGANIGKLTYWSPQVVISDRSFLNIGDHVIVGAGARLISHLQVKNKNGDNELLLKDVIIGDNAVVGGFSVLGPGTKLKDNIATRAFHLCMPFSTISKDSASKEIDDI